ncbi:MAG: hypothetical protein NUV72_02435 [Bauldia sp.]|nr:hypothetical protein [Bauldia sp.]
MRIATAAAVLLAVSAAPAAAQDIDQTTIDLVTATATKGYAAPEAAVVSNIRKSRARNGSGYCGEVTLEGSTGTTVFHVILETPSGPSVLRLADFPSPDTDPNAATVNALMHNFGCVE